MCKRLVSSVEKAFALKMKDPRFRFSGAAHFSHSVSSAMFGMCLIMNNAELQCTLLVLIIVNVFRLCYTIMYSP